jgi:hypothetical protein
LVLHLKPAYFMPSALSATHLSTCSSTHAWSLCCLFPLVFPHLLMLAVPLSLPPPPSFTAIFTHSYPLACLLTHSLPHTQWLPHTHSLTFAFGLFLHTSSSLKHYFEVSTVHRGWA